jgi:hypothetical protein
MHALLLLSGFWNFLTAASDNHVTGGRKNALDQKNRFGEGDMQIALFVYSEVNKKCDVPRR